MPHLPAPNPKLCFHLVHQLYSHYCKCSLYKHIQNDVVSHLSALLAFILLLQVFKTSTNQLKKKKVTVTAFLQARLYYQHVNNNTVFHQLTLVCSLKTIVFPDKIFPVTLPWQFGDKRPIWLTVTTANNWTNHATSKHKVTSSNWKVDVLSSCAYVDVRMPMM